MIGAFALIVSLWLMFSLFLFAWLGPQRSARLWNSAVDHFHEAIASDD